MKKIIKLTESDLMRIVKQVVKESGSPYSQDELEYMRNNSDDYYPNPQNTKRSFETDLIALISRYMGKGVEENEIKEVLKSQLRTYVNDSDVRKR